LTPSEKLFPDGTDPQAAQSRKAPTKRQATNDAIYNEPQHRNDHLEAERAQQEARMTRASRWARDGEENTIGGSTVAEKYKMSLWDNQTSEGSPVYNTPIYDKTASVLDFVANITKGTPVGMIADGVQHIRNDLRTLYYGDSDQKVDALGDIAKDVFVVAAAEVGGGALLSTGGSVSSPRIVWRQQD
jgi:hypothetical protein